jgi:hypothetical protein
MFIQTKKMYSRWLRVAMVVALAVQLCACEGAVLAGIFGAGAGAGTVAYIKGELKTTLNHSAVRTHQATLQALGELKLPVLEGQNDVIAAKVHSRFADGKDIRINIKAITETTCNIGIRVGDFGDQSRSQKILDTIKKYL